MIKKVAKAVMNLMTFASECEYSERSHQIEVVGGMEVGGKTKVQNAICTVQVKPYIPRSYYGRSGYFYEKEREREVKTEDGLKTITETVTYYEMSEADKKFIFVNYVYYHLDQRQLSKLARIPQPYIYRYIKHNKLKPKYPNTPKSKRNIRWNVTDADQWYEMDQEDFLNIEIPEDIDFKQEFHLDPFPARSEWKARRKKFGLKNGNDWRNTPYDVNPGAKKEGDGSTARRKKDAKKRRQEERRKRNIKKYNRDQNTRYTKKEDKKVDI